MVMNGHFHVPIDLPKENAPTLPIVLGTRWASNLVWTLWRKENPRCFPGHPAHRLVMKNRLTPAVLHNIVTHEKPSTAIKETVKSQWKKVLNLRDLNTNECQNQGAVTSV
jgi:hypothetical protein